ncbi:PREDICTED: uncharacterized protein LOC107346550 [Acropora digitifera]|uniref:uncharacterized protein LOC107346550 n=1 Tax=Acropora digitifera TaxID=70779 RepID=UPI00077B0A66|nr:PREDICTED: uncharacterized protein LOC107346550 [Acropora digitifera]
MATNNSSGIQCEYSTDTPTEHVFKLIAYSIILFGSLVGNVLVILVVVLNRHMRSVTNYLMVNMAVADLLLTAFNVPVTIKVIATRSIDWSVVLCKIIPFTQSVSVASSVLTLTAIAIDRFMAILYPLKRYVTFPIAKCGQSLHILLPLGWALKGSKKAARFTNDQRKYLEDKFRIGQETGRKADPEHVAQEMRYARNERGERRFTVAEYLTTGQIQSFFSRTAAKLRHAVAPEDEDEETDENDRAAEDEKAFSDARNTILMQCAPMHTIVYDTWNLCATTSSNKLSKLTVALLREICSYFNMEDEPSGHRKKPYLDFISELVGACPCASSELSHSVSIFDNSSVNKLQAEACLTFILNSMATNNSSGIQCESSTDTRTEHVFKLIAYSIILFGSLVGNVLVILVVVLNRHMRSVTNYLIVNMAVADLLLTAINMPVTIKVIATRSIDWSVVLCKIIPFTQSVFFASSVLTLTAIAIDRFLAILYPLKRYVTFPIAYYMIAVVWIVSIAVSSPFLYAMKVVFNKNTQKNSCLEIWTPVFSENADKDFTVVLFVTFYVFPLSTMSVLYSFVIHNLWVRKVPGIQTPENQLRAERSKKKVLKMLLAVVVIFALCWLPFDNSSVNKLQTEACLTLS